MNIYSTLEKTVIHTITFSIDHQEIPKTQIQFPTIKPKLISSLARLLTICFLCILSTACELGYYIHLGKGQAELLSSRQPIETILQDKKTPSDLQKKLRLTQNILNFAKEKLRLPVKNQYSDYVHLDRPYAIWSLSATPPFSFQSYQWCYPLIGCAHYRGYFNLERAKKDQAQLEQEGYETYLRGVNAYSTLGWFADPLLSSFLYYPENEFIELIFHELAHAKMYVKNDTIYNESFATFVGQQGLKEFQQHQNATQKTNSASKRDFNKFKLLVLKYKALLNNVYKSDRSDILKANEKQKLMTQLHHEYNAQKKHWHNPSLYNTWISTINNAKMQVFDDYESMVPYFQKLFNDCNQNWSCFYQKAKSSQDPHAGRLSPKTIDATR